MAVEFDQYNPIRFVNGLPVRSPSVYQVDLNDVSAADSGRTEDALMHKNRIAQKRKITLAWNNIKTEDASAILQAFNPEYISVEYLDPMVGGFVTKTFYVGDRSVPAYSTRLGLWSNVGFNIIER